MHLTNNIDLLTLQTMPTDQKWEWVHYFEIAKEAYDTERLLANQKLILEYMIPRPKPR